MARRGTAGSSNATADGEVRFGLADLVLGGAPKVPEYGRTFSQANSLKFYTGYQVQAEHGALQQRAVYYTSCA